MPYINMCTVRQIIFLLATLPPPCYCEPSLKRLADKLHISGLCAFNGAILFAADDGNTGTELWASDGTDGTALLADICVGACSSSPASFAATAPLLFFAATTADSGRELWSTDGSNSARLVADVFPGRRSSSPDNIVECGERGALFAADGPNVGRELYVTDGTEAGTRLVADLFPGTSGSNPEALTLVPGFGIAGNGGCRAVFFARTSGSGGCVPWVTDGTATGTMALAPTVQVVQGDPTFTYFRSAPLAGLFPATSASALLVFAATADGKGSEPWITDGTPRNTALLVDLSPGSQGSDPGPGAALVAAGLYCFSATAPLSDGTTVGRELWCTDGTANNTFLVADIAPGSASSDPRNIQSATDSGLSFTATMPAVGREPWFTDGSVTGTVLLRDTAPGTASCMATTSLNVGNWLLVPSSRRLLVSQMTAPSSQFVDGISDVVNLVPHGAGFAQGAWFTAASGSELWSISLPETQPAQTSIITGNALSPFTVNATVGLLTQVVQFDVTPSASALQQLNDEVIHVVFGPVDDFAQLTFEPEPGNTNQPCCLGICPLKVVGASVLRARAVFVTAGFVEITVSIPTLDPTYTATLALLVPGAPQPQQAVPAAVSAAAPASEIALSGLGMQVSDGLRCRIAPASDPIAARVLPARLTTATSALAASTSSAPAPLSSISYDSVVSVVSAPDSNLSLVCQLPRLVIGPWWIQASLDAGATWSASVPLAVVGPAAGLTTVPAKIGPLPASSGTTVLPSFAVIATDTLGQAVGAAVGNTSGPVTLTVTPKSTCAAPLSAPVTVGMSRGAAIVSGLRLSSACVPGYTLELYSPILGLRGTAIISVVAGAAVGMVFTQQPSYWHTASAGLQTPPILCLVDTAGNVADSQTAISCTVRESGGVAFATPFRVAKAGGCYQWPHLHLKNALPGVQLTLQYTTNDGAFTESSTFVQPLCSSTDRIDPQRVPALRAANVAVVGTGKFETQRGGSCTYSSLAGGSLLAMVASVVLDPCNMICPLPPSLNVTAVSVLATSGNWQLTEPWVFQLSGPAVGIRAFHYLQQLTALVGWNTTLASFRLSYGEPAAATLLTQDYRAGGLLPYLAAQASAFTIAGKTRELALQLPNLKSGVRGVVLTLVDAGGNALYAPDNGTDSLATVTLAAAPAPRFGESYLINVPEGGMPATDGGIWDFSGIAFGLPASGNAVFTFSLFQFTTTLVVTIQEGSPIEMQWIAHPPPFSNNNTALTRSPVIKVNDLANNTLVSDSVATLTVVVTVYPDPKHELYGETQQISQGLVVFSGLFVWGYVGPTYNVTFSAQPYWGLNSLTWPIYIAGCELWHPGLAKATPPRGAVGTDSLLQISGYGFRDGDDIEYYCVWQSGFDGTAVHDTVQTEASFQDSCHLYCHLPQWNQAAVYYLTISVLRNNEEQWPVITDPSYADVQVDDETGDNTLAFSVVGKLAGIAAFTTYTSDYNLQRVYVNMVDTLLGVYWAEPQVVAVREVRTYVSASLLKIDPVYIFGVDAAHNAVPLNSSTVVTVSAINNSTRAPASLGGTVMLQADPTTGSVVFTGIQVISPKAGTYELRFSSGAFRTSLSIIVQPGAAASLGFANAYARFASNRDSSGLQPPFVLAYYDSAGNQLVDSPTPAFTVTAIPSVLVEYRSIISANGLFTFDQLLIHGASGVKYRISFKAEDQPFDVLLSEPIEFIDCASYSLSTVSLQSVTPGQFVEGRSSDQRVTVYGWRFYSTDALYCNLHLAGLTCLIPATFISPCSLFCQLPSNTSACTVDTITAKRFAPLALPASQATLTLLVNGRTSPSASVALTEPIVADIFAQPSTISLRSGPSVSLPEIRVTTTDSAGNSLEGIDNSSRSISVSISSKGLGYFSPLTAQMVSGGVCAFRIKASNAPATPTGAPYILKFSSMSLVATVSITVVPGVPRYIQFGSGSTPYVQIFNSRSQSTEIRVAMLDSANNTASLQQGFDLCGAAVLELSLVGVSGQATPPSGVGVGTNWLVINAISEDYVLQQSLTPIDTDPKIVYPIYVWNAVSVHAQLSFVWSQLPPGNGSAANGECIQPDALDLWISAAQCSGGSTQFQPPFSIDCIDCPDGAICDGSSVLTPKDGYWRPGREVRKSFVVNEYNYSVFKCPGDTCLGATGCREGTKGPLCLDCQPGWGSSGLACGLCRSWAINFFSLLGIVVAALALVIFLTRLNLAGERPKELSQLMVLVRMLMTHLQMISVAGSFKAHWKKEMRSIANALGYVGMPPSKVTSLTCLIPGINQYVVFIAYACLPLLIVCGAGAACFIVSALRSAQRFARLHRNRTLARKLRKRSGSTMALLPAEPLEPTGHGVHDPEDGDIPASWGNLSPLELQHLHTITGLLKGANRCVKLYSLAWLRVIHGESPHPQPTAEQIQRLAKRQQRQQVMRRQKPQAVEADGRWFDLPAEPEPEHEFFVPFSAAFPPLQTQGSQVKFDVTEAGAVAPPPSRATPGKWTPQTPQLSEPDESNESNNEELWGESFYAHPKSKSNWEREWVALPTTPAETQANEPDRPQTKDSSSPRRKRATLSLVVPTNEAEETEKQRESAAQQTGPTQVKLPPAAPPSQFLGNHNPLAPLTPLSPTVHGLGSADWERVDSARFIPTSQREEDAVRHKFMDKFTRVELFTPCELCTTTMAILICRDHKRRYCERCFRVSHLEKVLWDPVVARPVKKTPAEMLVPFENPLRTVFLVTCLVTVFLLFPTVMKNLLSVLTCTDVMCTTYDKCTRYLTADVTIMCDTDAHRIYKYVAWGLLPLYGLGIPVGSFLILRHRRFRLHTMGVMGSFGFLYCGYRIPKCYFWESVVQTRKIAVVLLSQLSGTPFLQAYLTIWLMLFCMGLNVIFHPWNFQLLANLENASLLSVLCSVLLSLLYKQDVNDPGNFFQTDFPTYLILGINAFTILLFVRAMIVTVHHNLLRAAEDDGSHELTLEKLTGVFRSKVHGAREAVNKMRERRKQNKLSMFLDDEGLQARKEKAEEEAAMDELPEDFLRLLNPNAARAEGKEEEESEEEVEVEVMGSDYSGSEGEVETYTPRQ
eukprot:TRINITY_DN12762_c0_g1_i1.p1 TRINITY_DN12762_c0_g1~~TRINITY_DN12762_c0_g1_i1.p1  ORF type:complete len:3053 (-),score=412.97 TRINITY_DN12762_c0_g1_i1:99-9257(-)